MSVRHNFAVTNFCLKNDPPFVDLSYVIANVERVAEGTSGVQSTVAVQFAVPMFTYVDNQLCARNPSPSKDGGRGQVSEYPIAIGAS